jgi:hypothetical protein
MGSIILLQVMGKKYLGFLAHVMFQIQMWLL